MQDNPLFGGGNGVEDGVPEAPASPRSLESMSVGL
eukprot:SAG31_NODE_24773_length_474_cov_0.965333_1_plen_34_part_01